MAISLLKTKNKLLSICQHNNIIYIGDFLGNVYKLEQPYNSYQIIADFDEPISALEVYENNVIAGTWKGNLYFAKKSIHVEEGIVTAIKTLKQYLFVTVNTTLYCYKGMEMKYKVDTTYKVNAMTVTNNSILFAFNMPYTGILHFLDDDYENPLFSTSESQHQAGITGIECVDNKIYTSSCDKTVICNGEVVYTGDEWVRCMHDDVFGVGKNIIYKGNKIYEHRDWVSCVLKCNDRIFSIGLDGVIMVYTLVNNFEMFDKEFDEYMKE